MLVARAGKFDLDSKISGGQTRMKVHRTTSPNRATQGAVEQALLAGRPAFLGFLAKRLGNQTDAEDVLQEFCIRVFARKDQLREVDRMEAWLYSVLRSTLNDHYRKSGRRKRLGDAYAIEMQTAEDAGDAIETMAVICGCVKGLLSQLRPADRELIQRIDFNEEDRASVAADLEVKPGTLAVRLHRAHGAIADLLLGHCGFCCKHNFEDCACPPAGCEHPDDATDCADTEARA
jgi:RNA polymerase sigma factor (sigma-70 family)